jgi:Arrestin (or S-antigen), N-terminal domain
MATTMKVFKKTTANEQLTMYLGQREFYDCLDFCQAIQGVVVVDDEYLKGRPVFAQLIVNYQYGRDEDEVMGIKFEKDFLLFFEQIYPAEYDQSAMSTMQTKTIQKHGDKAHPFMVHFPKNAPNSVILQDDEPDVRRKYSKSFASAHVWASLSSSQGNH